ncbi:MAG: efflux RND transporter periplasmic adaptor subunit [Clostridiales Family XIII bacterium]|jgi:multidrug resistance efflux pump|nr:efflux RND transporter periplasmic adaptor subunit [Clostridiales Family XIII bacterium]
MKNDEKNKNKTDLPAATDSPAETAAAKPGRNLRKILLPLLLVVVAAGCGTAVYFYDQSANYFTTDNAKVTAKMYSVYPVKAGEILEWDVALGEQVHKNQILGRQDVLPYITAPIDGLIVQNDAAAGQNATPAAPVAVIADTANMYIGVNIEETDIVDIAAGQTAEVRIDAYKGEVFHGVVTEIEQTTQTYFNNSMSLSTSGTYTKVTQLVPVKVQIENDGNFPLTFGMNATVKIHLEKSSDAVPGKSEPVNTQDNAYSSTVEAGKMVRIAPDIAGKIASVRVTLGQKVKKGDVLLTLETADAALQLNQAAAGYQAAQVVYENSRSVLSEQSSVIPAQVAYDEAAKNYERMQTLYSEGAVPQMELDGAKAKMESSEAQLNAASTQAQNSTDTARAQLNSAKAALDIARQRLAYCSVKAPIDAEVLEVNAHTGDMASQQSALITLIDAGKILLRINVTESHIGKIAVGTPAEILLLTTENVIAGNVSNIAPGMDPITGMFEVEVSADNAAGLAETGMAAEVRLPEAE